MNKIDAKDLHIGDRVRIDFAPGDFWEGPVTRFELWSKSNLVGFMRKQDGTEVSFHWVTRILPNGKRTYKELGLQPKVGDVVRCVKSQIGEFGELSKDKDYCVTSVEYGSFLSLKDESAGRAIFSVRAFAPVPALTAEQKLAVEQEVVRMLTEDLAVTKAALDKAKEQIEKQQKRIENYAIEVGKLQSKCDRFQGKADALKKILVEEF